MDILDDMGVSKLSAKAFSKVNYSFLLIFTYITTTYFSAQSTKQNNYLQLVNNFIWSFPSQTYLIIQFLQPKHI